ncbi:MAG TPA: 30S ribosomal protein S21 [Candidatus Paceibacterota bacterium]
MSAISIKRKEGESTSSLVYRFTKKVQQSGVLVEAKRRRFKKRAVNRNRRRRSALHRRRRSVEIERARKLGKF